MYVLRLNSHIFCTIYFTANTLPGNNILLRYPVCSATFIFSVIFCVPDSKCWQLCEFRHELDVIWLCRYLLLVFVRWNRSVSIHPRYLNIGALIPPGHVTFLFIVLSTISVSLYVTASLPSMFLFVISPHIMNHTIEFLLYVLFI
jgi:hypothetical protein